MISVDKANYAGEYILLLSFNNGKTGSVNLKETIFNDNRLIFTKLKDISNFKKFEVKHNTVTWFEYLDIAPEYLFYLAFKECDEYKTQFKKWGYAV